MFNAVVWIITGPILVLLGVAVWWYESSRPKNVSRTMLDYAVVTYFIAVVIMVTILVALQYG